MPDGMTGRDINTVKSEYAKNFPEDYRKIAYDAGVADAAASVNARTEAYTGKQTLNDEQAMNELVVDYTKRMMESNDVL